MDWGSAWAQLGAVGLLGVVLAAVFSGRLLPRWWVRIQLDRADAELRRCQAREEQAWQLVNMYREAASAADQRADLWLHTLQGQGSLARSVGELAQAVPAAIAAPPPIRGDGG